MNLLFKKSENQSELFIVKGASSESFDYIKMMKYLIGMIILTMILNFSSFSQNENNNGDNFEKKFPPITLTNYVEFNDSKFNNPLAGCAFLLDTEKDTLAVTCKHALWVAKSDTMKYVHFENTLKEWRMRRKDDSAKYILADKLLNESREELINEDVVHKDYLVFTIKENYSDVKPLKVRKTEIKTGEKLYLVGWTFQDKSGPQRIYKGKFFKKSESHILIEMDTNANLAGLSGSPVLDGNGLLVGIVSNYTFDKETNKWYNSPCSIDYLNTVIQN